MSSNLVILLLINKFGKLVKEVYKTIQKKFNYANQIETTSNYQLEI
jgi:hypothetical protein